MKRKHNNIKKIMIVSLFFVAIVSSKVIALGSDFPYTDVDLYVADSLLLGPIGLDGIPSGESLYSIAINHRYTYQIIAEEAIDAPGLAVSSVIWKNIKEMLAFNFGDLITWRKDLYKLILIDYLKYQEHSSSYDDVILEKTVKYENTIMGRLLSDLVADEHFMYDHSSIIDENARLEYYKKYSVYTKYAKFQGLVDDVLRTGETVSSFSKNLANVMALAEAEENRISLLKEMKMANLSNSFLCDAVDEIIEYIENSYENIAFSEVVSTMIQYSLNEVEKSVKNNIIKNIGEASMPELEGYLAALEVGRGGLDLLFDSDSSSVNNIKIYILYEMYNDTHDALRSVLDSYSRTKTPDNARKMIDTFIAYVEFQKYATSWVDSFVQESVYGGWWNKVFNAVSSVNIDNYQTLKEMMENDLNMANSYLTALNDYYNLYYTITEQSSSSPVVTDEGTLNTQNFEYCYINGGIKIVKYTGDNTTVTVPQIINGDYVISIGEKTFYGCKNVTSIVLPESLMYIDNFAFYNCSALDCLYIPDGVKSVYSSSTVFSGCPAHLYANIGSDAAKALSKAGFYFCEKGNENVRLKYTFFDGNITGLEASAYNTSINVAHIPGEVTAIAQNGFSNCYSLAEVTFEEGIKLLSDGSFSKCTSLKNVDLPDSLTTIGDKAFISCSALESLIIPKGVTSVSDSGLVFSGCPARLYAEIGSEGAKALSRSNLYFYVQNYDNAKLKYTFDSFDEIMQLTASAYNKTITSVQIPTGVTAIEPYGFSDCISLTEITIPEGVVYLDKNAFYNCSSLVFVALPESLITIEREVFENCTKINELYIPDGVTMIGDYAFLNCLNLETIRFSENVESLGYYVFQNCTNLKEINLSNSISQIGNGAFKGCTELESISLSYSLTSISSYMFENCSELKEVRMSVNVMAIESFAFRHCKKLERVLFSDTLESIGSYAFSDCVSLNNIVLPNSVTNIGGDIGGTFEGCIGLVNIKLSNKLISIGSGCFQNCTGLVKITIPENVTTIESYAFAGCTNLGSIVIPDCTTTLKRSVFNNCSKLERVTIGKNVNNIGIEAFRDCESLKQIVFRGDAPEFDGSVFYGVKATAFYPIDNPTWTSEKKVVNYGGNGKLTWVEYNLNMIFGTPDFVLPSSISIVKESAFEGSGVKVVYIPDSCGEISNYAFKDCSNLVQIRIPTNCLIGEFTFDGCENVYVFSTKGSYAEQYCTDHENCVFVPE